MNCKLILIAASVGIIGTAQAGILFSDNFNSENGGVPTLNYSVAGVSGSALTNWNVSAGSVDLIGNGYFDWYPGNGLYLDMDGSTNQGASMQSKSQFTVQAGVTYDLSLDLGQNHDGAPITTPLTLVFDGQVFAQYTYLNLNTQDRTSALGDASGYTFTHEDNYFTPTTTTTANIEFYQQGTDNTGMIIDNVQLAAVPEPSTYAVLGIGALGLLRRKRRS